MTEEILRLRDVVKRFGAFAVSDGVNLTVLRGELRALIGPNGAGKTTLVHQIAGGLPCDSGYIEFDGHDVTHVPTHRRVLGGMARSYQVTNVYMNCSVLDNLSLPIQAVTGSSLRFWKPAIKESGFFHGAQEMLARLALQSKADTLARNLSHGEQRRLEIGLALSTNPKLLLLDEPLAGMGPEDSERMVDLIAQLKRCCTVLLIEHDMDAVFRLADRISVLVSGRVIATGAPDEVRNNADVKRAYLGDEVAA